MTNKEKYQRAFSALHASEREMEVTVMERKRKVYFSRFAAVCAAVVLIVAMASVAYAADVGGIQGSFQLWIHGTQTNAVFELIPDDDMYTITYEDSDGEIHEKRIGSVMYEDDEEDDESARAITEDEIVRLMNMPDVEYKDDGTIWVYYYSQSIEITDKFDENGIGYVEIENGDETLYMTILDEGNYAVSPHGFTSPEEFDQ